ncbi:hypothetical protein HY449_02415 [Candidatus Pacearchaeota archaeon]|nr:hypothetical protein [Candidatus Pacearchaeota archaeon]
MSKKFPRKEIYVYTSPVPLGEGRVVALKDREFSIGRRLREYSEKRWETDNKGWNSSVIPTAINIETDEHSMIIHCGLTEYKYLLGRVKFAAEKGESDLTESVNGLSTEIVPITPDDIFPLERRSKSITQQGAGFYDVPSAGQNAQMWLDKLPMEKSKLVKDIFDMFGFPRWNLIRNLSLEEGEIGEIFYTGFSKGFEVSLDMQFNGYVKIKPSAEEIRTRKGNMEKLFYRWKDLPEILRSINNNGRVGHRIKEDIYGNIPQPTKEGFKIVDDCLGTLLSNTFHLNGKNQYLDGMKILKEKGYKVEGYLK